MDNKLEKAINLINYLVNDIPLPLGQPRIDKDDMIDLLLYYIEVNNMLPKK